MVNGSMVSFHFPRGFPGHEENAEIICEDVSAPLDAKGEPYQLRALRRRSSITNAAACQIGWYSKSDGLRLPFHEGGESVSFAMEPSMKLIF